MTECTKLERTMALADGELSGALAEAARDHVATCVECGDLLGDVQQLEVLPRVASPIASLAWYRQRRVQVASVGLAVAAGLALWLGSRTHTHERPVVALASTRPVEARFAWDGAAGYRSYAVQRAGALPHESIPLATLADVERGGDLHGVGVLAILDGDLAQATRYLDKAGGGPDVLVDRAALALQSGDPTHALALADEALDRAPDNAVAMWNRALALRDLGLEHGAAEAFRLVAQRGELGWSSEAKTRADALEAGFDAQLDLSLRVANAAARLARSQDGLSLDDAQVLPGLSRIELYDAIRAAPTAAALNKLLPLAKAIDAADHTVDAIAMIARTSPDPTLAAGYAAIVLDTPPPRTAYVAKLRAAHANDLLIGALVLTSPDGRTVPDADLAELTKLTDASPDPWFHLLGIEQLGRAALERHDLVEAERVLLRAGPLCDAGAPSFRCMKTARLLGETYLAWQRLPEARAALFDAWKRARALQQWEQQSNILRDLLDLAVVADVTVGGGLSLARAYSAEASARAVVEQAHHLTTDACDVATAGHERVATVLFNQLRFDAAARELAKSPPCDLASYDLVAHTARVFVRTEVARVFGTPAQKLRAEIVKLRAAPGLQLGERALLDEAEGRLLVDHDPAEGEPLLHHAISLAKTASITDSNARRAAGISYSLLVIAAAQRNDGLAALGALADELGVPVPPSCALGLAVEDSTVIAVARDVHGAVTVDHHTRSTVAIEAATLVPTALVTALRGCPVIDVLARPPFHGISRVLPDELAWRYLSARTHPVGAPSASRVVVADVTPPPVLGLPRLSSWQSPGAEEISGATATPQRVLAAIGNAGEVVIHAHGLADRDDASYLALSPDANGRYALTAGDVRAATFSGNPLVILAACSAAQAAPTFHERWSLPAAFMLAGARAVVASSAEIPDDEAGPFFEALRTQIATGVPIAVALRDLRQQWLARPGSKWVRDIIVFE